ncbi:MAG: hypothetical protein O7B25_02785 [Gammaproteobacteria bacterium]|nr:hypothetical protein [Gammaproteobacteria bacterium]
MKTTQIRNATGTLLLAACVLTIAGCGGGSQNTEKADGKHFLSDQQQALERSKAAAKAMTEAAAERAEQTEEALKN